MSQTLLAKCRLRKDALLTMPRMQARVQTQLGDAGALIGLQNGFLLASQAHLVPCLQDRLHTHLGVLGAAMQAGFPM